MEPHGEDENALETIETSYPGSPKSGDMLEAHDNAPTGLALVLVFSGM